MRLLSWNVNGIRAVHKKGFLEWLSGERPDVLCLQETKARPEQLPPELRRPRGYAAEWHWGERKGYSGVATLSRLKPLKVERGLGLAPFDNEGRALVHHYPGLVLFNIYFPNGRMNPERLKFKLDFYEAFLGVIDFFRKRGEDRLVVCGDVNTAHQEIDLARPRENRGVSGFLSEERSWIDRLLARGFVDSLREFERGPGHYTWWDLRSRARERNAGWRLDYFFVSENLRPRLKGAFILPGVPGSDHCPVGIELA